MRQPPQMKGEIMEFKIQYRLITCNCGLVFALPEGWVKQRESDHKSFYCPNCKTSWSYINESETEKLTRLLNIERQCCISAREEANYFEKKAQGYKGYATKLKKQLKNS